jgi:predicted amidophosphoribosyltransferase
MEALAPIDRRCKVCDLELEAGQSECWNRVCGMPDRGFAWNFAIAVRSGDFERALNNYKFSGHREWAAIFGRILVGFLDGNAAVFKGIDLIVSSPTYTKLGARRSWDHTQAILVAADREQDPSGRWPFDLSDSPAVVKSEDTEPMLPKTFWDRKTHAEGSLREALNVPNPDRTRGRQIAVVDDVFTTGLTLREVARALIDQGGAEAVVGISLMRQPAGRAR